MTDDQKVLAVLKTTKPAKSFGYDNGSIRILWNNGIFTSLGKYIYVSEDQTIIIREVFSNWEDFRQFCLANWKEKRAYCD